MICVELDDEGETPEGVPFASILASVQHLGVAAVASGAAVTASIP